VRWFGVALNIERLKRVEEELRKSQDRLLQAQQAGHVGVFDLDFRNKKSVD
jgi:hypothetical protein